jgi:hypothetical protein
MGLCLAGGALQAILAWAGLMPYILFLPMPWVGVAVFFAGVWALLSTERLIVNLGEGVYVRQETGLAGLKPRRGRVEEFDALVVVAQDVALSAGLSRTAAIRIVLHFKGVAQSPMVLTRQDFSIPAAGLVGFAAQPIISRAVIYASAMGIPVYNNADQFSSSPIPPI